MKYLLLILVTFNFGFAASGDFETEAKALATDLKTSLMKNLSDEITRAGPVAAIPFCHVNVMPIAKGAAAARLSKFEFGRTSHKVRNEGNSPQSWAIPYLKEFEGKKKGEVSKTSIIHRMGNGKMVYLEPLYVESKCLLCHGANVSKEVGNRIKEIYPKDQATGFTLGEFRGFIWVKQK